MKKMIAVLLLFCAALSLAACADVYAKGAVCRVSEKGDAVLDIMPQKLLEKAELGGKVIVSVGDFCGEMTFTDEPAGEWICLYYDRADGIVRICLCEGSFCEAYGVEAGARFAIRASE